MTTNLIDATSFTKSRTSEMSGSKSKFLNIDSASFNLLRDSSPVPFKSKPSRKRTTRPVQFDDRAEANVVHHLEYVEREDRRQLWFSKQEIKALRQEGKITLAKVNQAGGDLSIVDESMGESIRGLEDGLSVFDREGSSSIDDDDVFDSLNRSQRRKNIRATILKQQQEQRDHGIAYDPKGLQVTSKACTKWARDRAINQAQKDFSDAIEVWKQDAACAALLPSIMKRKPQRGSARGLRSNLSFSSSEGDLQGQQQVSMSMVSPTLSSALAELDDMSLDF